MKVPEIILTETAWIHGGDKVTVEEEQDATLREFLAEDITHVNGDLYPLHAFDALEVKSDMSEKEIEDDNCNDGAEPMPEPETPPTFEGVDDATVAFGGTFNPREGVTAKDGNGNDLTFEVRGAIDTETPGEYELTYTATDQWGKTTTITRKITVETPTTGPVFGGIDNVSIKQGVGIDLTSGVTAKDATGQEVTFTVSPTTIDKCEVGPVEVTYASTDEWGNTTTVTRTITITQNDNPTISGLTELTVEVGEEFDPLDGVTAKDANGNDIEVEIVEPEPTDEWELIAELGAGSIISKTVLGTTPLAVGDTLKCVMTMAYDIEQGDQSAHDYEYIELTYDAAGYGAVCSSEFRVDEWAAIDVMYGNGELFAAPVPGDNGVGFQAFKLYKKVA